MTRTYKKLSAIESKIIDAQHDPAMLVHFHIADNSVQAELRLTGKWYFNLKTDYLHAPKNMSGEVHQAWAAWSTISFEINRLERIGYHTDDLYLKANIKSQTGAQQREEAENQFRIDFGNAFLAAYAEAKKRIKIVQKEISFLQSMQKEVLKDMRKANSEYMAERKQLAAERRETNTKAFESGNFWEADQKAIKEYFHPPFKKNHLTDVSDEWRAALFLECESISYKTYRGNWGHKLSGTGRAYLCGIDDNGDEWGHECEVPLEYDQFYNMILSSSVESAMMQLFDISRQDLSGSFRQGDLLFSHAEIPEDTTLVEQDEPWEIRESHTVESKGLLRNGRYFKSNEEIHVTHTTHHPVILPAGEYRLYTLEIENAD